MEGLVKELCKLTVFILCAQAIISVRPKECYEKYLKVLVNLLILLQFFMPLRNLLSGKQADAPWDGWAAIEERLLGDEVNLSEKGFSGDEGTTDEGAIEEGVFGEDDRKGDAHHAEMTVEIEIDPVEVMMVE